ncbi:aminotransferase class V-fold PLP-dependent enzyme [Maridesulfovibrio sp.]|uniref:aminotransferase class V-fold PLP-dependent enzyme n=1 Tax=Maridesulfovibrio sp. TaxID=2795000 RepID=UPI002A1896C6|nr:aminotransferase class V-fold PLP-dependent enzyme [Maridesulfovibrio sp.]
MSAESRTILPHSWPDLRSEDAAAVARCFKDEFIGFNSSYETRICHELRQYVQQECVVTTPSGSIALLLALKDIGIEKGDEVIISAVNCWSVYHTITFLGGTPVLCDIRSAKDLRASAETISASITSRTKAIIATHMFGALIEVEQFKLLKEHSDIPVVCDYSSSFGSQHEGRKKIGAFSDYVIGSFGSTKPLPGGNGGFLATAGQVVNPAYAEWSESGIPFNIHVSGMIQALILSQLENHAERQEFKKTLLDFYRQFVTIENSGSEGLFRAITFSDTAKLEKELLKKNIEMDSRDSAQPNLAKEMKINLKNAMSLQTYKSLPFNRKTHSILRDKGVL